MIAHGALHGADIAAWRDEGDRRTRRTASERRARFGFAIFFALASRAVENRLPMILDY